MIMNFLDLFAFVMFYWKLIYILAADLLCPMGYFTYSLKWLYVATACWLPYVAFLEIDPMILLVSIL